ncbi:hypothetical protein [Halocynthiibacter namhaensis]|uniref:hypothetical protein n=1 Tax=Halocynthiibacter namhaensis TaxID=1290553 RepID=UPI0012DFF538|nr:hypothetical protein [Halocynthiibacter namhaensis]
MFEFQVFLTTVFGILLMIGFFGFEDVDDVEDDSADGSSVEKPDGDDANPPISL